MAALMQLFSFRTTNCLPGHLSSFLNAETVYSARVLINHVDYREMSRHKRRRTNPPFWWGKRRTKFFDQYLTSENQQFVQEVVQDKYFDSSPLKKAPWPQGQWSPGSVRCGVIARKIGIYPMWKKDGTRLLTTVLQVLDNHVIRYVPPEVYETRLSGKKWEGKYGCLVVGVEARDPQMFTSNYCGLFQEAGVMPKRKMTRFIITANAAIQPGTPLSALHFRVGDYVDCYGKTVDHGFQGVVKRWGMKGGPASHGTTKAHRRVGSIGSGRKMSRVWPGKKMPGHMGSERRTLRGLRVWRINTKHNVIWVHGPAVPGEVNSYVYIYDTRLPLKKPETPPPFPTYYSDAVEEELPEELYDPELHPFTDPTILFENEPEIVIPVSSGKGLAKTASKSKR